MSTRLWQLQTPVTAIAFDCDGTLSRIEGIDELAKYNGVSDLVQALTAEAMGKTGLTPTIYQQRLDLVKPKYEQVLEVGKKYIAEQIPDIASILGIFMRLKKSIYILSAGLDPAVVLLGNALQIPRTHIFAVNITFDAHGNYLDFDRNSPLVNNDGKRTIMTDLKKKHSSMIYVGDGLNDLSTMDVVTRFIGYGGIYYRAKIAERCQFYIKTLSPSALIPLSLTAEESQTLLPEEKILFQQGIDALESHQVLMQ